MSDLKIDYHFSSDVLQSHLSGFSLISFSNILNCPNTSAGAIQHTLQRTYILIRII